LDPHFAATAITLSAAVDVESYVQVTSFILCYVQIIIHWIRTKERREGGCIQMQQSVKWYCCVVQKRTRQRETFRERKKKRDRGRHT